MKLFGLASAVALAGVIVCAAEAQAQCNHGRGGGGGTPSTSVVASSGTTSSGASGAGLLTGQGSWAYDAMRTQLFRRAYLQQQALAAAQRAARHNDRKADAQMVARQRRQEELYRRSQAKTNAMTLASN
jgi:hypothetical protein